MKIAVIIPTWKRPQKLARALQGLEAQTAPPARVLVTYRAEDQASVALLEHWRTTTRLAHELVEVHQSGVVHAENEALRRLLPDSSIELVAFHDDDSVAPPEWCQRIAEFFAARPEASALGGPDFIVAQPWTYHEVFVEVVGRLTWYGKVIGHHHHRSEGLREVDVLKGVNMIFRRTLLELLDERLQGRRPEEGNGVFWELDLCLRLKRKGARLFFDPGLVVQHDSDHSHFLPDHVEVSTAHNMTYVLLKNLPPHRAMVFLLYSVLIGHNNIKGLARTALYLLRERRLAPLHSMRLSLRGLCLGLRTYLAARRGA